MATTREQFNARRRERRRNLTPEKREEVNAYKREYNRRLSGSVRENRDAFIREYKRNLTPEQKNKYNASQRARRKNLSGHCLEVVRECRRRWNREHPPDPEKKRIRLVRYRARKTEAGGSYTLREWDDLVERFDHRCLCCGKQEPEIKLEGDHIVPVSKGGSTFIVNIQPLCGKCNKKKSNKTIDYRRTIVGEMVKSAK